MSKRQIILDTETTGLDPASGHRIIEIGCVELINRRFTNNNFHSYLNPERDVEAGALKVHGISQDFLQDKPLFKHVIGDLLDYLKNAELIIHNAPFDVGFLNCELQLSGNELGKITDYCSVTDTLAMARSLHPGQRNSLDALCKRYRIDNSQRELHGALLDAKILGQVYLAMTGGQGSLFSETSADTLKNSTHKSSPQFIPIDQRKPLSVITPSKEEEEAHLARVAALEKASGKISLWRNYQTHNSKEEPSTVE